MMSGPGRDRELSGRPWSPSLGAAKATTASSALGVEAEQGLGHDRAGRLGVGGEVPCRDGGVEVTSHPSRWGALASLITARLLVGADSAPIIS